MSTKKFLRCMVAVCMVMVMMVCAYAENALVTGNAAVYDKAENGKKVGTVNFGTEVTVVETRNGWAKVRHDGNTGFMKTSSMTKLTDITAYAAEDGVRVYKSNSTGSDVAATINKGSKVRVTAVWDGWCRVTKDGRNYYIQKSKLTKTQPVIKTTAAYVAKNNTAVYASRSEYGKVLGHLGYNTKVAVEEVRDSWCKIRNDKGEIAYIPQKNLSKTKVSVVRAFSTTTPASGTADTMDWWKSNIRSIFSTGTTATVTDVDTGIAWKVTRSGGSNHADCQPCTADDTAAMLKACGSWSWERRAIIVTVNGNNYAASMNCQPHGNGTIDNNNFDGHFCIHFKNSRTHGTDKVCELHQAAIEKADRAY